MKFCKHCGEKIPYDAIICTKCGRQVEKLENTAGNIVINNNNNNANNNANVAPIGHRLVNKWTAFWMCVFGGWFGLHKFYEGKAGMGVLYLCTFGLLCIGWALDIISILGKPDPYYV